MDGIGGAADEPTQGATAAPIVQAFAAVVRRRREALGLTQEKMADLPRNTVIAVERGRMVPSLVTIERFAKALQTTPDDLVRDARLAVAALTPPQSG